MQHATNTLQDVVNSSHGFPFFAYAHHRLLVVLSPRHETRGALFSSTRSPILFLFIRNKDGLPFF